MATIVAINNRDALVMGCDSLGTVTRRLLDPFELLDYFEDNDELKLKLDSKGKPVLNNFSELLEKSQLVPYNHMTHVDKLFSLEPLEMAVMIAGIVAIGDRTVKNLIGQFKTEAKLKEIEAEGNKLGNIGTKLLEFLGKKYEKEYPDERRRPELELMLGGYDKAKHTPGIVRIYVHKQEIQEPDYDFGIYFGAQTKEIQRLVHGTDVRNLIKIGERNEFLFQK